ncbi:hypothetical protein BDN70DRAFT_940173, partial [Pholiota conissans]
NFNGQGWDVGDSNASSLYVPNPSDFVAPPLPDTPHYSIVIGQPVGVVATLDAINIADQESFAFRHSPTWSGAVGHYSLGFHGREVRLVPVHGLNQAQQARVIQNERQAPMPTPQGTVLVPALADSAQHQHVAQAAPIQTTAVSSSTAPAPVPVHLRTANLQDVTVQQALFVQGTDRSSSTAPALAPVYPHTANPQDTSAQQAAPVEATSRPLSTAPVHAHTVNSQGTQQAAPVQATAHASSAAPAPSHRRTVNPHAHQSALIPATAHVSSAAPHLRTANPQSATANSPG